MTIDRSIFDALENIVDVIWLEYRKKLKVEKEYNDTIC
jgi:hypothetical protein